MAMLTASVIGCGFGGGLSLEALAHSERYELVAACDLSAARREAVASRFPGVRLFDDDTEMLARVPADVVCVATPAPSHVPISRRVIERPVCGLLVEKPLSLDTASARSLLDEIERRRLPVTVPHGMLCLPAPQAVRTRLLRGDIGEITAIEVTSGVDLLNAGIHWLAYLLDLLGDHGIEIIDAEFDVADRAVNDGARVESRGLLRLQTDSGIRVTLHSERGCRPRSDVLPAGETLGAIFRITGRSGSIELSAWGGSYWIREKDATAEIVRRPLRGFCNFHQAMLDGLARQVGDARPDYRIARLSLEALGIIESAYRHFGPAEWPLGTAEDEEA